MGTQPAVSTHDILRPDAAPSFREMSSVFGAIGLQSFGGPAAQIALMHRVLVEERRWLDERSFLSALSFCMLLPGPEAMQLATYSGWRLRGTRGGLAAGLLFLAPGAALVLALSFFALAALWNEPRLETATARARFRVPSFFDPLCGFIGGILGGVISDLLLRRGFSLTAARKIPIVGGMLLSMSIIGCNYVQADALVVGLMALAFFGKGIGALGWAVVADTSPRESGGLSGGLFHTFGNTAGITTPIAIGYIVQSTGSFNGALVFVGLNALVACFCYLVVVGEIRRVELKAH